MDVPMAPRTLPREGAAPAGRQVLEPVEERGWRSGFANLLRKENSAAWGGWRWLWQLPIWLVIFNGLLAIALWGDEVEPGVDRFEEAAMVFMLAGSLFGAIGVVIMNQSKLIGEKQSGTAAWILSKPVARPAFLLAKLVAGATAILLTMVLFPGVVAYLEVWAARGQPLPVLPFAAAMLLFTLNLLFYLGVTLLLGARLNSRTPVIAIPLAFLAFQQNLAAIPVFGELLPWSLLEQGARLMLGQGVDSVVPLIGVPLLTALCVVAGVRQLEREEF